MKIIKKTYKKFFEKVLSGEKKFDIRLGDVRISRGDIIVLKEIDDNRKLTGREIKKKIGFVLYTKELNYWPQDDINKFGFVVMQLE